MNEVRVGERYRHFKGKEYVILNVGFDSDSLKKVVVYRGEYDSEEFGSRPVWVRDYEDFVGYKDKDGVKIKRFELIEVVDGED